MINHPPGQWIEVRGKRLWVEREGRGEPLVVLTGGPADSHFLLHPAFSQLADAFEIIYLDYAGLGKSEPPLEGVTFNGDVADLEGLRAALGFESWNVYGFSYGGMVAQAHALAHPGRVSRLVLANTLHSPEMWQLNHANIAREIECQFPEIWERILALKAEGVPSSDPRMRECFAVHRPIIRFHDASKAALLPDISQEVNPRDMDLYFKFVGADIDWIIGGEVAKLPDFRPRLHALEMPLLIIAGRYDRALYPKLQMDFKRFAPQARFVMMERSGSFAHVEEPDSLFPLLREFLAS